MNKILELIGTLANGVNWATYKLNNLLYRASPIKYRQDLVITGLIKGKPVLIDLAQDLKHDLLVTGVNADLTEDDGKKLQSDRKGNYSFSYAQVIVTIIDRITKKRIRTIVYFISSYPQYRNEIILSPDYLYEFVCNQEINSITFTGEPVYRPTPIIFTRGVTA